MIKRIAILFYFELLAKLRRPQEWLYPLIFFLIVMMLLPFAIASDDLLLAKIAPGFIWIIVLLTSLMSQEQLFQNEMDEGYLEQCLISTFPLTLMITIKLCVQWITAQLPFILLAPLLGILFHLTTTTIFYLIITLVIGSPLLTLIATFGAALTLGLKKHGLLMSLLIFPLIIPILIFAVNIVLEAQMQLQTSGPIAFLCGLTLMCCAILPYVIACVLRIGIEN